MHIRSAFALIAVLGCGQVSWAESDKGRALIESCENSFVTDNSALGALVPTIEEERAGRALAEDLVNRMVRLVETQPRADISGTDLDFGMGAHAVERAANFILQNDLVDRYVTTKTDEAKAVRDFKGDVTALVNYLSEVDRLTSPKMALIGKVSSFMRAVPVVRRFVTFDPVAATMSIREQIDSVDQSLETGRDLLRAENKALDELEGQALKEADLYRQYLIRMELLRDALNARLATLDPKVAEVLERRFGSPILKFSNMQKGIFGLLAVASKAIAQKRDMHEILAANADSMRYFTRATLSLAFQISDTDRVADREYGIQVAVRNTNRRAYDNLTNKTVSNAKKLERLQMEPMVPAQAILNNLRKLGELERSRDARLARIQAAAEKERLTYTPVLGLAREFIEARKKDRTEQADEP